MAAAFGVQRGDTWWRFDPRSGAMTNKGSPSHQSGLGQEVQALLQPSQLLSVLRLTPTGDGKRAGHEVVRATGVARPRSRYPHDITLMVLGRGADSYEIEADKQRGVLLRLAACHQGGLFTAIEATELHIDEPIAPDLFVFEPPVGESVRDVSAMVRERLADVSLSEAIARVPFQLLIPERVPAGWELTINASGPSRRPPSPAHVVLHYRSRDATGKLTIGESDPETAQGTWARDTDDWQVVDHETGPMQIKQISPGGPLNQLRCERQGTAVGVTSPTLDTDALIAIAATLRPAPTRPPAI